MSAIFGFSGEADDRLEKGMSHALRHRGSREILTDRTELGTIGFVVDEPSCVRARLGCGLHADGTQALAVAGLLTGESAKVKQPRELLTEFQSDGLASLHWLRGDFVVAVRDGNTFHLVRDGAGARTIYHSQHQGRFVFASEPKSIWSLPGFSKRIRPASIAQYLSFSFVPGAPTMLEGLDELPAGHTLTFRPGQSPCVTRYFFFEEFPEADPHGTSDEAWVDQFRKCLSKGIQARQRHAQPTALFLSGGLDSSVVCAELSRQATQPIDTYALHFGDRYFHELDFAKSVATRCGTNHHEVLIRPRDFVPRLREMVWHLDDPIGDPITMPNFEMARRVSSDYRYIFNGEGGDPCFGGPKNLPMMLAHWYGGERAAGFRERAYLESYRRGYELVDSILLPEWRSRVQPAEDLEGVLRPFFECTRPTTMLDKLLAINVRLKGAHLILPKVERMLGAVGVVPLSPLFSHEMVQLSFRLPPHLKLAGGVEKVILKKAYADQLPAEIIHRPKSGMRVPVHYWFQRELRSYVRSLLSPRHVRRAGIFDPEVVRQIVKYEMEGRGGRFGLRLWMLVTFELWRRIVVEGEAV